MLPIKDFLDFIRQYGLFERKNQILTAVSGGKDSVLLAHLLKKADFNFAIAHCNFGLRREESTRDETFTARLAQQLEVPFFVTAFPTSTYADQRGVSTQMAARDLRYTWFENIRADFSFDLIALAHHRNDSVETVLLNQIRGTGIAGMHGILPRNGNLVRPMQFLNREEIDDIILKNDIPFVEDSSNASTKYARNLLRLEVIPRMKQINPRLEETFSENSSRFLEMEQLLENNLSVLRQEILQPKCDTVLISLKKIKSLKPMKLLLFGLLRTYGFTDKVVDDIILSLDKHPGKIFESPQFQLLLDREALLLTPKKELIKRKITIEHQTKEIDYQHYILKILHDDSPLIVRDNPMATSVDESALIYPLTLRNWEQGDYFYPLGMRQRKKLSDFFINEKVPLYEKNEIPVLVNGNGEVIWVAGFRLDNRYKVRSHTKKVIIFELFNRSL